MSNIDMKNLAKSIADNSNFADATAATNRKNEIDRISEILIKEDLPHYEYCYEDKLTMKDVDDLRIIQTFYKELADIIDPGTWINPNKSITQNDVGLSSHGLQHYSRTYSFHIQSDYYYRRYSEKNSRIKEAVKASQFSSSISNFGATYSNPDSIYKKPLFGKSPIEKYVDYANKEMSILANKVIKPWKYVQLHFTHDDDYDYQWVILFSDGDVYSTYHPNFRSYESIHYNVSELKNEKTRKEMVFRLAVLFNKLNGSIRMKTDILSLDITRMLCKDHGINVDDAIKKLLSDEDISKNVSYNSTASSKTPQKGDMSKLRQALMVFGLNSAPDTIEDLNMIYYALKKIYHPSYGTKPNHDNYEELEINYEYLVKTLFEQSSPSAFSIKENKSLNSDTGINNNLSDKTYDRSVGSNNILLRCSSKYAYNDLRNQPNGKNMASFYQAVVKSFEKYYFKDEDIDIPINYDGRTFWYKDFFDCKRYSVSFTEAKKATIAAFCDHPLAYFAYTYMVFGNTDKRLSLYAVDDAFRLGSSRKKYSKIIEDEIKRLASEVSPNSSGIEAAQAVYDKMSKEGSYDTVKGNCGYIDVYAHSVASYAEKHMAVCEGLAKTFQAAMLYLGYECLTVSGYVYNGAAHHSDRHAWNMIKIGDKWHVVDVTSGINGHNNLVFVSNPEAFREYEEADKLYDLFKYQVKHPSVSDKISTNDSFMGR